MQSLEHIRFSAHVPHLLMYSGVIPFPNLKHIEIVGLIRTETENLAFFISRCCRARLELFSLSNEIEIYKYAICLQMCSPRMVVINSSASVSINERTYSFMLLFDLFRYGSCECSVFMDVIWAAHQKMSDNFYNSLSSCFHKLNRAVFVCGEYETTYTIGMCVLLTRCNFRALQMLCIEKISITIQQSIVDMLDNLRTTLTHLYITTAVHTRFMAPDCFTDLTQLTHLVFINAPHGQNFESHPEEIPLTHAISYFRMLSRLPKIQCVSLPRSVILRSTHMHITAATTDTIALPMSLTTFYLNTRDRMHSESHYGICTHDVAEKYINTKYLGIPVTYAPTCHEFFKFKTSGQSDAIQLHLLDDVESLL